MHTDLLHLQLGRCLVLLQADGTQGHQLPLGLSHPGQLCISCLLVLAQGEEGHWSVLGSRDGAHGELGTVGMTEGPSRDKLLTPQCGEKGTLGWGSGLGAPAVGFEASWSSHLSPHPPCVQGKGHPYKQEHFLCSSMEN